MRAMLAGLVLLALYETSKVWLDPLIAGLSSRRGGLIGRIIALPLEGIRNIALSIYNQVEHQLSIEAAHHLRPASKWIRTLAKREAHVIGALAALAAATAGALEHGFGVRLPREIGKRTRPIDRRARRALKGAIAAGLAAAALRKWIRGQLAHNVLPKLRAAYHAGTVTLPREIGRIRAREKALERQIRYPSKRWLRRIAGGMFLLYLLGAFLKVLARRFPWLFCRKVKTVGNRVCGLDPDLLAAIIGSTLLVSGNLSLVAFAREVQGLTRITVDGWRSIISDW